MAYLKNRKATSSTSVTALLARPAQNRYSFAPSYLKKPFLLSSSSRTFCFITLVRESDCFSRAFVALCMASIFACKAF